MKTEKQKTALICITAYEGKLIMITVSLSAEEN